MKNNNSIKSSINTLLTKKERESSHKFLKMVNDMELAIAIDSFDENKIIEWIDKQSFIVKEHNKLFNKNINPEHQYIFAEEKQLYNGIGTVPSIVYGISEKIMEKPETLLNPIFYFNMINRPDLTKRFREILEPFKKEQPNIIPTIPEHNICSINIALAFLYDNPEIILSEEADHKKNFPIKNISERDFLSSFYRNRKIIENGLEIAASTLNKKNIYPKKCIDLIYKKQEKTNEYFNSLSHHYFLNAIVKNSDWNRFEKILNKKKPIEANSELEKNIQTVAFNLLQEENINSFIQLYKKIAQKDNFLEEDNVILNYLNENYNIDSYFHEESESYYALKQIKEVYLEDEQVRQDFLCFINNKIKNEKTFPEYFYFKYIFSIDIPDSEVQKDIKTLKDALLSSNSLISNQYQLATFIEIQSRHQKVFYETFKKQNLTSLIESSIKKQQGKKMEKELDIFSKKSTQFEKEYLSKNTNQSSIKIKSKTL